MKQYSYRKFEASNAPTIQAYKKAKNALYPELRGVINRYHRAGKIREEKKRNPLLTRYQVKNRDGFRGVIIGKPVKRHGKAWQSEQAQHALETEKHFEKLFQELGLNA
jgi:hypothetical protein